MESNPTVTRYVPILPKPTSSNMSSNLIPGNSFPPEDRTKSGSSGSDVRKVPLGRDKYHVIEAIARVLQEHPAIYQTGHPKHVDGGYVHACWVNMRRRLMQECSANTLEKHNCLSVRDLKNKLHNLRGMFLRQKKKLEKLQQNGEDASNVKLWMWYKKFEFLNNEYVEETSVPVQFLTSTPPCSPVHYLPSKKARGSEEYPSSSSPSDLGWGYESAGRKRGFDETFEDSYDEKPRHGKSQMSSSFLEQDETDTFLLFLGSKLRKLPEMQRDEIQMKVLKFVQHEMKALKRS